MNRSEQGCFENARTLVLVVLLDEIRQCYSIYTFFTDQRELALIARVVPQMNESKMRQSETLMKNVTTD